MTVETVLLGKERPSGKRVEIDLSRVLNDGEGEGGSLPDWWTVDDEEDQVTFAGVVMVKPSADFSGDGFVFQAPEGDESTLTFDLVSENGRASAWWSPAQGLQIDPGVGSPGLRIRIHPDDDTPQDPFQIRFGSNGDSVFKIDSTGRTTISPIDGALYALLITDGGDFQDGDTYSGHISIQTDGTDEVVRIDDSGVHLNSRTGHGSSLFYAKERDSSQEAHYGSYGMQYDGGGAGKPSIRIGGAHGIMMQSGIPSTPPGTDFVQIYYDHTPGAAKLLIRAKDDNGDEVAAEIPLAA